MISIYEGLYWLVITEESSVSGLKSLELITLELIRVAGVGLDSVRLHFLEPCVEPECPIPLNSVALICIPLFALLLPDKIESESATFDCASLA